MSEKRCPNKADKNYRPWEVHGSAQEPHPAKRWAMEDVVYNLEVCQELLELWDANDQMVTEALDLVAQARTRISWVLAEDILKEDEDE